MLNFSKKYPLIFFHLAKNAGKSICKALQIDKEHHPPHLNQTVLLGDDIKDSYSKQKWDELNKFTVVRNPWDRMVSLYHFRKKQNDLLIRLQHKGLWEPKNGDSSQEGWLFKKWLLDPEIAGVQNHNVFFDYKQYIKNQPKTKGFFKTTTEYINQLDLITDINGVLHVDYIIRYENLIEEFESMFKYLNLDPPELPSLNTSSHKKYQEYYDEESKNFIYKLFKKDINYFEYEF
jgi:hypothetical protein|tara:strand:+ start:1562 stop:2260 length:699 start_codon:yes stop_codon:yes gene_type:complete